MENIEEKFKKLMKKEGMEKLTKSDKERFEELMKKGGLEKLTKSKVYIAKLIFPPGQGKEAAEVEEKFKTEEEREEWYKKIGIECENAYPGTKIKFIERLEETEETEKSGDK